MNQRPAFHGSDLEEIEKYYQIPKEDIIGFGANVNPLGLSEKVKYELSQNLEMITSYPDREYTSLRRAIGEYCQIPPSDIVVGNGSTELISLVIAQRHPKHALLLGPTYSEYERELTLAGGQMQTYYLCAEQDFQLDLDAFCQALDDSLDLLIICNPNNPTSSALTVSEMERILTHCRKHDIFVMIDETYVEFAPCVEEISAIPLVSQFDNVMILRGVSKFFAAPGLRLGYGITSNENLLHTLHERQNPWSLNSIGAFAGERMFKDKDYLQLTRNLIQEERTRICDALKQISALHVFEPVANFILVQILKPDVTSSDLFDFLIRRKLMIRDCSSFEGLNGEFIRFCIMKPEENTLLIKALHEFFAL